MNITSHKFSLKSIAVKLTSVRFVVARSRLRQMQATAVFEEKEHTAETDMLVTVKCKLSITRKTNITQQKRLSGGVDTKLRCISPGLARVPLGLICFWHRVGIQLSYTEFKQQSPECRQAQAWRVAKVNKV